MASDNRPLIVVSGLLHPDGKALLESQSRVVVTDDPTEEAMMKTAAEADGILFRIRPRCTAALLAACKKLKVIRSEEHTSELQSLAYLVCRLLLEKKKNNTTSNAQRE